MQQRAGSDASAALEDHIAQNSSGYGCVSLDVWFLKVPSLPY